MQTRLAVDLLDVLRVEQHHLLVDKMRTEVEVFPRAAADRQRGLIMLEDSTTSMGRPKFRLHIAVGVTVSSLAQLFIACLVLR